MFRKLPSNLLAIGRCFSTSTSRKTSSVLRTTLANPTLLNESHEGRFYTIEPEVYKRLFGASDKGIGLPPEFKIQCTTFREASILVRKPFLDIKRCIEAYDVTSMPVLRYILYGEKGVGKTITVANLVHYGHGAGYLIVHIPWAPLWTRFAKDTEPNPNRPNFVDHTVDSAFWLQYFRHQNSKLLEESDLKTSKTYEWSKRENTPAGSSFIDIIEHGISRPAHAAECIYALIAEIKVASSEKKIKTMVAVDGVNALFMDPGRITRQDKKTKVPYTEVTLFDAFKQLFASDWTGGVVICTVDSHAVAGDLREMITPRYLLGKDGWEHMDPFIPVYVDKYSSVELQTTIDYYLDRKWLQHPLAGTKDARTELETVSCRNPLELMEICKSR